LSIVPNIVIAKIQEEIFKIPKKNIMICGAPRSFAVRNNKGDTRRKILLAPAPRNSIVDQENYINSFFEHADKIDAKLQELDLYMDFFLDKRFATSEKSRLRGVLDKYTNIDILNTGDLFCNLPEYELMVNDYGNVMFDFILLDKPVVLLNADKEKYLEETPMLYDYDYIAPGQQTDNWDKVMEMVEARLADPSIDEDLRARAKRVLYDMNVNDPQNSERIIKEVKKRLDF
ncbi:MAG: CDP-glycerol glycerophosphotransferase family protein, partial [Eubacterium sp.]|nr:CDP-glycerol glycerophosphotransferase family protein [Eubacterium sp.]